MIICHEHKFIFIRVTRCGSHDTIETLKRHLNVRLAPIKTGINHPTAAMAMSFVPEDEWIGYFKFSYVRNPWAWWVSVWERARLSNHHDMTFEQFIYNPPYNTMDNIHSHCPLGWSGNNFTIFKLEYIKQHGLCLPGMKPLMISHENVETTDKYYFECYNNSTRKLVANLNGELIERFHYIFGEDT